MFEPKPFGKKNLVIKSEVGPDYFKPVAPLDRLDKLAREIRRNGDVAYWLTEEAKSEHYPYEFFIVTTRGDIEAPNGERIGPNTVYELTRDQSGKGMNVADVIVDADTYRAQKQYEAPKPEPKDGEEVA